MPAQKITRFFGGVNAESPHSPLAMLGVLNPLNYHIFYDDFDNSLGAAGIYTATKSGNGTIAHAAGDGGNLLFTTNNSTPAAADLCSIQLPTAGFTFEAGKRMFFLVRLKMSAASNGEFLAGLMQTTTTPFTITDGLVFQKPTGALTGLVLKGVNSSTAVSLTIPTASYSLANDTYIELAWFIDRRQIVYAFAGSQLVGYLPYSGTGSVNSAGVSVLPVKGACASMAPSGMQTINPTSVTFSPTTANLNVTVAMKSGTAASSTMTVDFVLAAKER